MAKPLHGAWWFELNSDASVFGYRSLEVLLVRNYDTPMVRLEATVLAKITNPSEVIKSKFPALRLLFISCFEGDKISPTPKRTNMPCASDSLLISKKWRGVFCYFVSSQTYGGPTLSSFISHPNLVLGHLALNVYLAHLGSIWGSLLWRHQTDICKIYNWPPYSPGFQRRMIRGWKNENALGRGSWECNFHPAYFSRPA